MSARRRVLLAPVTVTPSKPLTPSHLKGLFWTDVMFRATTQVADVTYLYQPDAYHLTEQTLGFWEYLDRTLGDEDYTSCSEEEIGELYVRYRADRRAVSAAHLGPYVEAVEEGWVHPAGRRVLRHWTEQYARLGLHDPGLTGTRRPGLSLAETMERLREHRLCLDLRPDGGPVYLDATRYGLPLRRIVNADGRVNYLACALRELLPLVGGYDEVVLLYDRELEPDYVLLQRVLSLVGPAVRRVAIGRVPIDGRIRSARHGDWRGHTAADLLRTVAAGHDDAALRLGARMYFVATLGPGDRQSFRPDLLRSCLARAVALLARAGSAGGTPGADPTAKLAGAVGRHRGAHLYVDPYRLTCGLTARHRPGPTTELLTAVYL
nr:hypothetical protein [Micromonospora sp. DSM 115978]